uniref:Cytosolic endo-beta-N-acetylglucosaminidase n=1 Tax=Scleropages formosus TaxID=113540 RepID=A0A8C9T9V6_SCLFO
MAIVSPRRRKRTGSDVAPDHAGIKLEKNDINSSEACLDEPATRVHEVVRYESSSLTAKHYDPATGQPVSSGLRSLEELRSWQRSEANPFDVASVPPVDRQPPLATCDRRTLVCHDMMGGYLEDRYVGCTMWVMAIRFSFFLFIQGTEVEMPYVFYHWEYIDIFNYFSHNMVTIPPAAWTNAAHKHGVVVLGTFITEWKDGAETCEAFLADEESYRLVADKLVQIACYHGFDGWLVNIENKLSETAVKNTPLFLRYLSDQTHERIPGSLILWYDSVLEDGKLQWQNELNDSNRVFFDACDGFFTNYNWKEENLEWMKTYSAARGRLANVYVGVDVFARSEVVGGEFETNKSLELIRKHGLSVAIFAPGWVYECHDKRDFRNNQDKFWALIADFLYIHRPSCSLPFISSFCQGFGNCFYWKGKVEEARSWMNLSTQEVQPLYLSETLEGGGWVKTRGCPQDAWNGGCSLVVHSLIPVTLSRMCARVFSVHIPLTPKTFLSFMYKSSEGVAVSLQLHVMDTESCSIGNVDTVQRESWVLASQGEGLQHQQQQNRDLSEYGNGQRDGSAQPVMHLCRCFLLELGGCALRDICISLSPLVRDRKVPFECRIGEIMVLDAEKLPGVPAAVENVCLDNVAWERKAGAGPDVARELCLSATLRWRYPHGQARHFLVHRHRPDIPDRTPILVGRSHTTLFRVCGLTVPEPPGALELLVEPVGKEGTVAPQSAWGRLVLSYAMEGATSREGADESLLPAVVDSQ